MAGASIVANQPTGAGAGSPGVGRNDLWLSQPVDLLLGVAGNTEFLWEFLDIPPGSAAVLNTPTASTSGFTPDLIGTYRVRLTVNGGGPGNVQILVFRVRYSSTGTLENRGWAYPAFGELEGESNYAGNTRAWAEVFESILEDVRAEVGKLDVLPLLNPVTRPIFTGVATENANVWTRIASFRFDTNEIISAGVEVRVSAILEITNVANAQLRLYNVTDAVVVTGSNLSSASNTPEYAASLLTGLVAAGKIYEVQIQSDTAAETCTCTGAFLEFLLP